VQALIEQVTGRSLLTGGALPKNGPAYGLGNVPYNIAKNLPQASTIAQALGKGPKSKPTSLYRKDWQTSLAALLGAPAKKTEPRRRAQARAARGKASPVGMDWPYPYPWSRLEDLADMAELDADELRDYLRAEIARRAGL
jgi:hypothetical protein